MADDGAGISVCAKLLESNLPSGMRIVFGDSDILNLPRLWKGEKEIWLIDSIWKNSPPGSIHYFEHDDILHIQQKHATVHQLSLPEGLRWIMLAHPEMEKITFRLWAIEPANIDLKEELSPAVLKSVQTLADEIIKKGLEFLTADCHISPSA